MQNLNRNEGTHEMENVGLYKKALCHANVKIGIGIPRQRWTQQYTRVTPAPRRENSQNLKGQLACYTEQHTTQKPCLKQSTRWGLTLRLSSDFHAYTVLWRCTSPNCFW